MNDLRQFITARRKEIAGRGKPLHDRRYQLIAELEAIDKELDAIQAEWAELEKAAAAIGDKETTDPPTPNLTIKQSVLEVLNDYPDGLTSTAILRRIKERHFPKLDRTSLSPQLSRLKKEGKIRLAGQIWSAPKHEGPA